MIEQEQRLPPVPFPNHWDGLRQLLHIGNCAVAYLTCATFEEYPRELRAEWRERARQWLDAHYLNGSAFDTMGRPGWKTSADLFVINENLEYAERLWERTAHLANDPTCQA